jgi:hypothetical protein
MPRANRAKVVDDTTSPIRWQDRPFQQVRDASAIAGISSASIYKLAGEGRLTLRRLAGRTLVVTSSLVTLIENAEPWTASHRGEAGRQKRIELARSAWS